MISKEELGKVYGEGELIFREGDHGDCMFVIQSGRVEVLLERPEGSTRLAILERGDLFGEMSLFTAQPRSATVRAFDQAQVLTVNKRGFLKRIHEDPSIAFYLLQKMSQRIRKLNVELAELKAGREKYH
jgi:CRP-like cAMP-binding protein